ncbi:MAG: polynucleotide adenylyltransferase PcnB, partial [Gammaproteobacteria bacterium]
MGNVISRLGRAIRGSLGPSTSSGDPEPQAELEVRVIARPDHCISRSDISQNALKVLYRLNDAGYHAHMVGGGVRDLLLGLHPKDFDVATDATPEQVKDLFRNCRLIGRRFRLAHVHFGKEIIEVATFRAPHDQNDQSAAEVDDVAATENGRIVRDNVFGTLEEDAIRRDLTINALYYNIDDFSIIDYVGGAQDIEDRLIRLIGDPVQRYREDPVRMLRVIRFAAKLDFDIHASAEAPLRELGELLADVPSARLFEEVNKLFLSGHAVRAYNLLRDYDLFRYLFPATADAIDESENDETPFVEPFLLSALASTDRRISEGKPVTPAFLYAALLWEPVRQTALDYSEEDEPDPMDIRDSAYAVADEQRDRVSIPKRFQIAKAYGSYEDMLN